MNELLEKLLDKRGINFDGLDDDERQTFDRWQSVLNGKDLSIETIRNFCDAQLSIIEKQFENMNNSDKLNERLIIMHTVYKKIKFILNDSTKETREKLETQLTSMLIGS